jgi:hypothetical protein
MLRGTRCIKKNLLFKSFYIHRSGNEDIHVDELGISVGMVAARTLFTVKQLQHLME